MVFVLRMQLPQSLPKSAVIDMELSATRLHLPSLPLEHRHQTFSTPLGNHDAKLVHRPNGVGCILSGTSLFIGPKGP